MPPLIERAGRHGLIVALFVLGFFALGSFGAIGGLLSLASGIAGMVCVVRAQRACEREACAASGRGLSIAALASYGVAITFFAGLLVALVVYVALRFIWPDYIVSQLEAAATTLSQIPEYAALYAQLSSVLKNGPIPTAADMMASVLMIMMITGVFIGIVGAIIAKISNRRQR
ncbi:MAG: DUF4199 domain-containing protein [Muribaculaceae bacterium]|nr:DUF4199 domain-containing protein [Muribaculaceae bacterium]